MITVTFKFSNPELEANFLKHVTNPGQTQFLGLPCEITQVVTSRSNTTDIGGFPVKNPNFIEPEDVRIVRPSAARDVLTSAEVRRVVDHYNSRLAGKLMSEIAQDIIMGSGT